MEQKNLNKIWKNGFDFTKFKDMAARIENCLQELI